MHISYLYRRQRADKLNFMKKLFLILFFFSSPFFCLGQKTADVLATLPKDEFQIREIANDLYQKQDYDQAIQVFLKGRKILANEQLFTFELISLYRFKRDKTNLVPEYLNALQTSPQLLPQAQNVFSTLFENSADYYLLQTALLKKMQKEPDNEVYAKLITWLYLQTREYNMALKQLIAQDKRIKDDGGILFNYTQIFISNKAYTEAAAAYTYLLTKGASGEYFLSAKLGLSDVKYQMMLSNPPSIKDASALLAEYQDLLIAYGKNVNTVYAMRRIALLEAQYLHHPEKAADILDEVLGISNLPARQAAEIKLELGDIYVNTGKSWEAILLYGQVAKEFEGQDISNEAQYRSARLSFYQGNFSYAKSQADVLKASTTQLVANDALNLSLMLSDHLQSKEDSLALSLYAAADLLQFTNQFPAALKKLDSISVKYPNNTLHDDVLMLKAQIHIKGKDYAAAAVLLQQLISNPQSDIWTDDAIFTLAGLYEDQLAKPEQAKQLYQQLITDFPGSMYTAEARRHFRKLRGDNIES
jgi:TolA-binding protein